MHRAASRAASAVVLIAAASGLRAEPPTFAPCHDLPAAVAALASSSEIEAFGIAPAAAVAVAAIGLPDDPTRSVVRFAREGGEPRSVKLAGRVVGLAIEADGAAAHAIVRATDRKGAVRGVELVRLDLVTARASSGPALPATARGLAISTNGASLLVACRNEIRTFHLPGLASGPLYRAPGENVGVAPIAGSSYVLVAQPSRIVLADLEAAQGRDGLELSDEAAAPATIRGLVASAGGAGALAVADGGLAWCVRPGLLPAPPRAPEAVPEPAPAEPPPSESPVDVPPPVLEAPDEIPTGPGTVFGVVAGEARPEVAAVVLLGPDNVLREAARAVPDGEGRFSVRLLSSGTYRIVAAGTGGRVLLCDPPFITIRVDGTGTVEAPVLKVLRAQ